MALLVFGPPEARRSFVAVMRLVATAVGTRPFEGNEAELVSMFAALEGCAGCHGLEESFDFSDLLGDEDPWADSEEAIEMILRGLPNETDRQEAVHAGMLVGLFADEPDPEAASAARWVANRLGVDETNAAGIEQVASEGSASAKADLFRRFLSERIAVDGDVISARMDRHDLASLTRPETIVEYHRLLAEAPEGSLGAVMRDFYQDASFDIPGMPGVPLPVEFLGSHDVHHVLAGYNTSAQGEVYTAVFNAGNASAGIGWLSVVLLQWHQGVKLGVFPEGHSHLDPEIMATAAHRGSQTTTDLYSASWDWMALLNEPFDQVCSSLGIPEGSLVRPGDFWGPLPEGS